MSKNIIGLLGKHKDCLTKHEYSYTTYWKTSNFYVLPKIHKCKAIIEAIKKEQKAYIVLEPPNALKCRPIIAGPSSPTQHLSEILQKILSPIVREQKSYVKDDWDLLRKLPYQNNVGRKLPYQNNAGRKLLSCDVTSLYTSIPNDLVLEALHYWINR